MNFNKKINQGKIHWNTPKIIEYICKCISFIVWQIILENAWLCFKKCSKGFGDYVEIKLLRKKYYIHMSQENDPLLFIGLYSGIFTPKVRMHSLPKGLCEVI